MSAETCSSDVYLKAWYIEDTRTYGKDQSLCVNYQSHK